MANKEQTFITTGINDDYAITYAHKGKPYEDIDKLPQHYFGYESEDENGDWCYVVTIKGQEVFKLTETELISINPELQERPEASLFLLTGMNLYCLKLMDQEIKPRQIVKPFITLNRFKQLILEKGVMVYNWLCADNTWEEAYDLYEMNKHTDIEHVMQAFQDEYNEFKQWQKNKT